MESQDLPIKLIVPTPSKHLLSFCVSTAGGIEAWAKKLPMANTGESARQLFSAITEINHWQAEPLLRLKALEIIRPYIYSINTQLAKHFLVSSVALNSKQLKVAQLSQALQSNLSIGYKLVIVDGIRQKKSGLSVKAFALAIHRAMTEISQGILLSYQLYQQPAEHSWLEINQLYLFAEANRWLDVEIGDKQTKFLSNSTIKQRFIHIHLLAVAKPNNLRQQELALLYNCLELWVKECEVTAGDNESALFIIHLYRDRTAIFRQNLRADQYTLFRGINTLGLIKKLKLWSTNPQQKAITVPKQITDSLLAHVIQAWSVHAQRVFRRVNTEGRLHLCLGLTALHYYCAQKQNFEKLLNELRTDKKTVDYSKERARSTLVDDVWAHAFDADSKPEGFASDADITYVSSNTSKTEEENKHPTHQADIVNASPGGYSIRWQGVTPTNLQAGELLGIMEEDSRHWAVGVIRWIHKASHTETKVGIELLSPNAEAGGALLLQKTGNNGPFLRALILPEIKALAQPPSLIVPQLPFRTGNKIEMLFQNTEGRYQLVKRLNSTNSFSQFQFRQVGLSSQATAGIEGLDDSFDMLWSKL